jgi:hypothetical protein
VDAEWFGRYADATLTRLELDAITWMSGFYQLEHLLATREWARRLRADASPALLFAALVHDCERHFPGGPSGTPGKPFDDPDYLFAHSTRSGDLAEKFLRENAGVDDEAFIYEVRSLVLRHEIGGSPDADVLQAADSLSFLETLGWLTCEWVTSGVYAKERSIKKLRWSLERIRIPEAVIAAIPLYEQAINLLEQGSAADTSERRRIASDPQLLLGITDDLPRILNGEST